MNLIQTFELTATLDNEHFQEILSWAFSKSNQLEEIDEGYLDLSLATKGITIIYRDSRYKKKVRLLVNPCLVVDDPDNMNKVIRKLDKRIKEHFNYHYRMEDFVLSGMSLTTDINVGSRAGVADYLKVLQRIGRVKGFSPVSYDCFDDKTSFCLSGNSNDIDFLLYDLENAVMRQLRSADAGRKKMESVSVQAKGILRSEVRLTKPKAIRTYTNAECISDQIVDLTKNRQQIFLDTFMRVIPYGDFLKKRGCR